MIEVFDELADDGGPFDPTKKPRKIITVSQPKKATIAKRPKNEAPLSDAACTPLWLCELLPVVDFDPCSNPRSQIRARWSWSLEKGIDGLKMPWRGSGYQNFPYSDPMPWCVKSITEMQIGRCTELITLCKLDPSTEWWKVLTEFDPATIRLEPRSRFVCVEHGDVPEDQVYEAEGAGDPHGHAGCWKRVNISKLPRSAPHPLGQAPEIWLFGERLQFDEHPDLIEQRRRERIEKRRASYIAKGKNPDEINVDKINGDSSNNFCSVIIHHRPADRPSLNLRSHASRWVRA